MNLTVQCDFEDSSCLLVNDTSQKDQWMVVEAQGHPVLRDNTLNLGITTPSYMYHFK